MTTTHKVDFNSLPITANNPHTYIAWRDRLEEDGHTDLARHVMSLGVKILAGDSMLNDDEYELFLELVEDGE